ncbi:MAG: hypothetical protein DDT42_01535 [candidate division WS2 bacterium]|uniref:Uncharacterized protein n=1 Tax=Psychracetigena formicireducens TaxID=2986056 RepID=A0A9E2BJK7_PSYF1|nr:hypothetical protein [Candidatus Psychracetigena formicireducens]
MKVISLLKGGIYEVSFRYNPKMEGYTTLMSDIPKLYEIVEEGKSRRKRWKINRKEYG